MYSALFFLVITTFPNCDTHIINFLINKSNKYSANFAISPDTQWCPQWQPRGVPRIRTGRRGGWCSTAAPPPARPGLGPPRRQGKRAGKILLVIKRNHNSKKCGSSGGWTGSGFARGGGECRFGNQGVKITTQPSSLQHHWKEANTWMHLCCENVSVLTQRRHMHKHNTPDW